MPSFPIRFLVTIVVVVIENFMGEETKIIPTIGRLVYYKLRADDVAQINKRYEDTSINRDKMRQDSIGYQAHFGNRVSEGQIFPMIIVSVNGETNINGQLFLDGNDSFWVTSALLGQENGNWDWMPYQKGQAKKTEELEAKVQTTTASQTTTKIN